MLILDPPKNFRDFEAGTARAGQSADTDSTPFAIHFQTTIPGKLGASGFLAAITVDPMTYRVTGDTVSFTGDRKALGVVTFEGAFSPRFFKTISSHRSAKNSNAIVLTGTLRAGGKSLPVSFTWFDGGPD